MPTIGVAVTSETKERFDAMARQRSITASRLGASLILEFLSRESVEQKALGSRSVQRVETPAERGGVKSEQVFVRLDPYYFGELGRLASERNWYRSTYLANLFRAHADQRPVLCEAEINAVRQVARQLAAAGRNLNQIAKTMNVSLSHAHLTMNGDFELIRMLLDLEMRSMKDLIQANLRGWGINDAEA